MRKDFDYSMMSTYMTCARRYKFRYVDDLAPRTPATPLTFGHAIHSALDEWYASRDVDKCVIIFNDTFKEDLEVDDRRTNALGEWIIKNYHETYKDQPLELVHSEMAFDIEMPWGANFIGRIDKIVKWHGNLWLMDHKTTSSLGGTYGRGADPNLQFTGYTYAAHKLGFPVIGVLIDAISTAKGLLNSSSRSRLTPLARFDVYQPEWKIKEWLELTQKMQTGMMQAQESGEYLPNFEMCTYYGECPYRKLCVEEPEVRSRLVPSYYEKTKWDPRDGLNTKEVNND